MESRTEERALGRELRQWRESVWRDWRNLRLFIRQPFVFQIRFKQLKDPLVFVCPARGLQETMVLDGIHRHGPVFLSQLDEPLHESNRVLEMNVGIDHAMTDQQSAFQSFGKVDR